MENLINFQFSYLKKADGSCLLSDKETTILVSIFGPGDVKGSKQLADRAVCEINFKTTVCSLNVAKDTSFESLLKKTCESVIQLNLYPRTLISITLQQLYDDGSLKSTAINALSLALLDSGLPLKFTFLAVTVVLTPENQLIVRPSSKQEKSSLAIFIFVFYSNEPDNLGGCLSEGTFSAEIFKNALHAGRLAAKELFSFYRKSVCEKLTEQFSV